MVQFTNTERGVKSLLNSYNLNSSGDQKNNTAYNASSGTATSGSLSTIILESGSDNQYNNLVIEIINGHGEDQSRLITNLTSLVATVSPDWSIIPNSTSEYIIHCNSGVLPIQNQDHLQYTIKLATTASSIDNFYSHCSIKILEGNAKGNIVVIENYNGTTKIAILSTRTSKLPLNGSLYAIYGESGTSTNTGSANDATHIVLDGNNSAYIKPYHYIEINGGTGVSQIRMISSISGNIIQVSQAWITIPDNTSEYTIFSGYASVRYENVIKHAIITSVVNINVLAGERAIMQNYSVIDNYGHGEIEKITEISSIYPMSVHAITVITEFFRLKIIGMGTNLNGHVQTIYNSYKSGKVTTQVDEHINGNNDCDLTRSVITGKTISGNYCNVNVDMEGNLNTNIINPTGGFGGITVIEPVQVLELTFINNFVNLTSVQTCILNGGSITSTKNIGCVSSGTSVNGLTYLQTIKKMRYVPGLGVLIRFSGIFTKPIVNSTQLIGYMDANDGLAFGYNGLDFGILFKHGGKSESRLLTITSTSTINDNITIILNGISSANISILSTDNTSNIARKIAQTVSLSSLGMGWFIYERSNTVIFISKHCGLRNETFSYTANSSDSAGTFSTLISGIECIDEWISQYSWNTDRALGYNDLPLLDFTKGNIFEIGIQWLGFGNLTFKIENPLTGRYSPVHYIKYASTSTITSLQNPNLPLYMYVDKHGSDSTTTLNVKSGSMGGFILGQPNKIIGGRFGSNSIYNTSSGALTGGTYYNILTARNMPIFNNDHNYSEIIFIGLSLNFKAGSGITRGGIFTIYVNATLNNSAGLTWTSRNSTTSCIELCKDVVTIVSNGNETLSFPCSTSYEMYESVLISEMILPPGASITMAFKPYSDLSGTLGTSSADIGVSASWIQR